MKIEEGRETIQGGISRVLESSKIVEQNKVSNIEQMLEQRMQAEVEIFQGTVTPLMLYSSEVGVMHSRERRRVKCQMSST